MRTHQGARGSCSTGENGGEEHDVALGALVGVHGADGQVEPFAGVVVELVIGEAMQQLGLGGERGDDPHAGRRVRMRGEPLDDHPSLGGVAGAAAVGRPLGLTEAVDPVDTPQGSGQGRGVGGHPQPPLVELPVDVGGDLRATPVVAVEQVHVPRRPSCRREPSATCGSAPAPTWASSPPTAVPSPARR